MLRELMTSCSFFISTSNGSVQMISSLAFEIVLVPNITGIGQAKSGKSWDASRVFIAKSEIFILDAVFSCHHIVSSESVS